jgi:hypothetical protein
VQAVEAFKEMLPVFRHARCLNCHGGIDPLSEQHRGADQLDPEIDPLANREQFEEQCQNCHDGLSGWRIPGSPVFFVGRDDEALCMQMKQFEHTGELFVEHIENDHNGIQFIAAGFAGDRALGLDGLRDYGLTVEPPPGTQAELTAKARRWVDLLGDGYEASKECGCVMPKVKLRIQHTEVSEVPNGLPSREESEAEFEVALKPMGEDRPGGYAGQHQLTRELKLTVPSDCRAIGSREEQWQLYALVDSATGNVKVWRQMVASDPIGGISCRHGDGEAKMDLSPGTLPSALGFGEMDIPPSEEGTEPSKTETFQDLGYRESLTITVLELPPGE